MTLVSRHVLRAAAIIAVLATSACAVPGQGAPGDAATFGDRSVTDQQVYDLGRGFVDLGNASSGPGTPLTMALIGPALVDQATTLGFSATDADVASTADAWITFDGRGGTASPAALEVTRYAMAIDFLLRTEDGVTALHQVGLDAEAKVETNPRYGPFTVSTFENNLLAALNQGLANAPDVDTWFFSVFNQVSGFAVAMPDWISTGG